MLGKPAKATFIQETPAELDPYVAQTWSFLIGGGFWLPASSQMTPVL